MNIIPMFLIVINYTIVGAMEIPLLHTQVPILYCYILFQHNLHLPQISIYHFIPTVFIINIIKIILLQYIILYNSSYQLLLSLFLLGSVTA